MRWVGVVVPPVLIFTLMVLATWAGGSDCPPPASCTVDRSIGDSMVITLTRPHEALGHLAFVTMLLTLGTPFGIVLIVLFVVLIIWFVRSLSSRKAKR